MELPYHVAEEATAADTQNVTHSSETLAGNQAMPSSYPFCLALHVPRPLFPHPQPIIYLIISLLWGL